MANPVIRVFLVTATLSFATAAFANLLPNSGFDSNLQGWTTVPETVWSPLDSDGGTGSVEIELSGVTSEALTTCVPVTAGELYDFGVDILIEIRGNNVFGKAGLVILWKADPACAGGNLGVEGTTYANIAPEWTSRDSNATAPAGAAAALVELRATKSSGSGGSRILANLDDPYFQVAGSGNPAASCANPVAPYDDITASDALYVLRAAVGSIACDPCLCDVNDSGSTTSSDALATLRAAVNLNVTLSCPAC